MTTHKFTHAEEAALMALRDGRPVPSFARDVLQDLTRLGLVQVPAAEEGEGGARPVALTSNGAAAAALIARTLSGMGEMIRKPNSDNRGRGSWR